MSNFKKAVLDIASNYQAIISKGDTSKYYTLLKDFAEGLLVSPNVGAEVIVSGNHMNLRVYKAFQENPTKVSNRVYRITQENSKKVPAIDVDFTVYPRFCENNFNRYVHFKKFPKLVGFSELETNLLDLLENKHFLKWYGLMLKDPGTILPMDFCDELGAFGDEPKDQPTTYWKR